MDPHADIEARLAANTEWLKVAECEAATELPGIASIVGRKAADEILAESAKTRGLFRSLHADLRRLLDENRRMREALVQARGAILLDCMVDDDGEAFGTTKIALNQIDALLEGR